MRRKREGTVKERERSASGGSVVEITEKKKRKKKKGYKGVWPEE